jgi:hypothetical protein
MIACGYYPLRPAKPYPAKSNSGASVRGRSGHVEALAEDGAYLRVSGPQGRLRACYGRLSADYFQRPDFLVTSSILKAMLFRASGPGRRRFLGWERQRSFRSARIIFPVILYVVTTNLFHARRCATGAIWLFPNRRERSSPQGRALSEPVHRQAMNRLFIYMSNKKGI